MFKKKSEIVSCKPGHIVVSKLANIEVQTNDYIKASDAISSKA